MQYVKFGRHGLDVSRLGFGTMRLPTVKDGEKTVIDRPQAIGMIRRGIDGGITYVDTAYMYHDGESEIVTGLALRDGYRERVQLTTKMPPWYCNEEADMNRLLDEQLKKLDVAYLDNYLLHALNRDTFRKLQSFHYKDFLRQAIRDGRIRRAGFSFHDDYDAFMTILNDWDEWDLCQIQFNYLDDREQATADGLREAGKRGLAVVIMEPLRGGALANPPGNVKDMIAAYEKQRSAVEWAFAYVADHPEVSTILSGMSTPEQLEDNLRIFDALTAGGLTEEERAFCGELKQAYLSRMPVKCTGCAYCQPCPQDVHIPNIFRPYDQSKMFDSSGRFQWEYGELVKKGFDASKCVQCGSCESVCPQHISIIDWLQTIDREYRDMVK